MSDGRSSLGIGLSQWPILGGSSPCHQKLDTANFVQKDKAGGGGSMTGACIISA